MASRTQLSSIPPSESSSLISTLLTASTSPTSTTSPVAPLPVSATAPPTSASSSLSGGDIAGIAVAAVATAVIIFFAVGFIVAAKRKRRRTRATSPSGESRFDSSEKSGDTASGNRKANFSRGGGGRDLNAFASAYPRMQDPNAGYRPDPQQIGVAMSPEDDSPESMQSMHSVAGLLPAPPPKDLRIAPQRFQPQRRRRDSDMTQFEEDMQIGYPENRRRLQKAPKSPRSQRKSLASMLSFHAPVASRSPDWRRPSPPKLVIPEDPRASLIPPPRPMRPPSDGSLFLEPLAPTKPTFQITRPSLPPASRSQQPATYHDHPSTQGHYPNVPHANTQLAPPHSHSTDKHQQSSNAHPQDMHRSHQQQVAHPPDQQAKPRNPPPHSLNFNRNNPPGLLFPPPRPSPAASTYSNLPSSSRDYIPSYYCSSSPFHPPPIATYALPPPPPLTSSALPQPLSVTSNSKTPSKPSNHGTSKSARPKSNRRESNASDTSFESLYSESTPPDDTGPTSPPPASTSTFKTPVTPPRQNGTPLTPIDEGPSSPISALRYPKIPRASNQAVARPSPPPSDPSHTREGSLLEKRRGQDTAHDLEKGLWITGSNTKIHAPSGSVPPRNPADGAVLTSPPGPAPPFYPSYQTPQPQPQPPYPQTQQHQQRRRRQPHIAKPEDAYISPTSPPFPTRSSSRTHTSPYTQPPTQTPTQTQTPKQPQTQPHNHHTTTLPSRTTLPSKTSSYNSRGSSPTLPPPTPRSPITPNRTQARVLKARGLAHLSGRSSDRGAYTGAYGGGDGGGGGGYAGGYTGGYAGSGHTTVRDSGRDSSSSRAVKVEELVMKSPLWDRNPRLTPRREGNGDLILEVTPR
ncbi:MAG: hypothetical protein M1828_002895 [Chrysothrix sp. TS-e1954]|nr:MAG: hypothetical protein M1828_002895 [Chrysothrix sp. TS-e1954]